MTGPLYSPIYCAICGKQMGKKPGVQVTLGVICSDPICNYQSEPTANMARDALIVAGVLEKVPVAQVAFASDMTRQRVYQIFEAWRQGA